MPDINTTETINTSGRPSIETLMAKVGVKPSARSQARLIENTIQFLKVWAPDYEVTATKRPRNDLVRA